MEKRPSQIHQMSPNLFIATEEQLVDVPFEHTNTIFFDMKSVSIIMIAYSNSSNVFLPTQIFSEKKLQTALNCIQVALKNNTWMVVFYNITNGLTTTDVQSVCTGATNNRLLTICELQKSEGQFNGGMYIHKKLYVNNTNLPHSNNLAKTLLALLPNMQEVFSWGHPVKLSYPGGVSQPIYSAV